MTRTTLILDEQRLIELKRLAAAQQRTLSSLVDEFLRDGLQRAKSSGQKRKPFERPVFHMGKPRVNVADRNQLYELMGGR